MDHELDRVRRFLRRGTLALLLVAGTALTAASMGVGLWTVRNMSGGGRAGWNGAGRSGGCPYQHRRCPGQEALLEMAIIEDAAARFHRAFGFDPVNVFELVATYALPPEVAYDRWQRPYRLRSCSNTLYYVACSDAPDTLLVSSDGPDGVAGTVDDIELYPQRFGD